MREVDVVVSDSGSEGSGPGFFGAVDGSPWDSELDATLIGAGEVGDDEPSKGRGSDSRVSIRQLLLPMVAVVALVAGVLGWIAGSRLQSSSDALANATPPMPSLISVPVEARVLQTELPFRAQARLEGSTELLLGAEDIITKVTKSAGDAVNEGDVLVENRGRPLFTLEGVIPAFRDFELGMDEGPDVKQLEEALARLGFSPGTIDNSYTPSTADAVTRLYRSREYRAAMPEDEELDRLQAAEDVLASARSERDEASERSSAADLRLADLTAEIDGVIDETDVEVSSLRFAAEQARTRLEAANSAVAEAEREVAEIRATVGASFPQSELVFIRKLPATVQSTIALVGQPPEGEEPFMVVSDGEQIISAVLSPEEGARIAVGDEATLEAASIVEPLAARVTMLTPTVQSEDGVRETIVTLATDRPLPTELVGESLLARIPLDSTDGSVLVVPLAAISAGPSGEQVEIALADGSTETVQVEPGLSADGLVEIRPLLEGSLAVGDRVVVGRDLQFDTAPEAEGS